jgi:hypothetical protein
MIVAAGTLHASDRGLVPVLIGAKLDLDTGVTTNVGGVSAAYNSADAEFRVAWFDSRITGQNDVYAQRVSAGGLLLGDNVPIIVGPASTTETSIAYDPVNNRYLITWRYQSGGPGSPGFNHTFGALASATGGLITTELDLSNGGLEPTLVYNGASAEYFLEARNFAGGGEAGIRGQRISANGQPIGSGITIATAGAPAPAGQLAWNSNANQYLATWRDQTAEDLKGRIINADGSFVTGPFTISATFPESGLAASVAFDPVNDRYLVVFGEFQVGVIRGQFVGPSGSLIGSAFTIFTSAGRLSPFMAYDPVNRVYLVAWYDSGSGSVSIQLLGDDGGLLGGPLVISGVSGSSPRVAANTAAGGFIVTWVDRANYPQRADVLAQMVGVIDKLPGDLNCDGGVDFGDINPFVLALVDPDLYATVFPNCNILNGDINGDGLVNFGDINPFVALLSGR